MAQLPLIKLGGLLIKTLAKPVAGILKEEAKQHPRFSRICVSMGQVAHRVMSRINVMAKGYKFLGIEPLPEQEAMNKGADLMSEIFIFTVGGGIMAFEYARSEKKSAEKAAAAAKKEQEYVLYLESRFQQAQDQIFALEQRVSRLEFGQLRGVLPPPLSTPGNKPPTDTSGKGSHSSPQKDSSGNACTVETSTAAAARP